MEILLNYIQKYLLMILILMLGAIRLMNAQVSIHKNVQNQRYDPPQFEDDKRFEKIVQTLPEVEKIFQKHADENNYPGYAYGVVVDGELVLSGGVGVQNLKIKEAISTRSVFRIASLTKGFTAMAIIKLMEENKLSLKDRISVYLPEFEHTAYPTIDSPSIKIKHLLTMTAGFPEDNAWADQHLDMPADDFDELLQKGFSFSTPPGTQFEYSNLSYALLGEIISRVSGEPYQQYITGEILEPLGMHHTYWEYSEIPNNNLVSGYRCEDEQWKKEPMLHDGSFGAIGGLITSIDDFSKYIAFQLSAWPPGNAEESGPLKRSSIRQMQKIAMPRLFSEGTDLEGNPCPFIAGYGYGLAVRINCEGIRRVNHNGGLPGFGTDFRFYPDYGIGIFSFANRTYASTSEASAKAIDTIVEKAGLVPRTPEPSSILLQRKKEVIELIKTWNTELEEKILAENFYLDVPKGLRIERTNKLFKTMGKILKIGPIKPENQLRGSFIMYGEMGNINVFFSLTPESVPKVQQINMQFSE